MDMERDCSLRGEVPSVCSTGYGGGYSPKIGECVIVIQSDIAMMNHQTRMLNNIFLY